MKTLQQLQDEHLPRMDWRQFIKGENLTPVDERAFDEYFKIFLPPGKCCKCGAQLGAHDVMDVVMGRATFQWGLAHGEGFCSTRDCGYPARAIHYNVGPIERFTIILQYHPDECSEKESEDGTNS